MARASDTEGKFGFTDETNSKDSVMDGPCQMAIVVPMIPCEEGAKVPIHPFSIALRDAIEDLLLENKLMYRGVAVKVNSTRLPHSMKKELYELRSEHKEEFLKDRNAASEARKKGKEPDNKPKFITRITKGGKLWRN